MCEVDIRIAHLSDLIEIREFASEHFHDKEPIEMSHIDKTDKMVPDDDFLRDCISNETTLMAFADDALVGILISGKILPDEAERNRECAEQVKSKKSADILRFLSFVEEKADYCNELKVTHSLHIHIISVHPKHQGFGIARKLFEYCIDNGRGKGFPAVSVDCSSVFTVKIAEKYGMTCLSTLTYDEYSKHIGETLFIPMEPHTVIKSYAKVFE